MTARTEPRSLHVDIAGSRRHVAEWGKRGAPVVVLQHGMLDHARSWDWVAERLAPDFHVLAPDLRGHGDSAWSPDGAYSLADFVADLADVTDAMEVPVFDLAGHSLGGHIALRFAASFPEKVRALAVIEGVELPIVRDQRREPLPYPQRSRRWIEERRAARDRSPRHYETIAQAEARMAEQHPAMDAETIAHVTRHGLIAEAGKGLRWKYDNACRLRAPDDAHGLDLDDVLDAITCQTLLAYGEASWIPVPPRSRLGLLRDHQVVTYPGASHWVHHQAREPFLRTLEDFLSRSQTRLPETRTSHA